MAARPYAESLERLKKAKLRPTRQRLALCRILFDTGDRHVSAEQVLAEAHEAGVRVSLATIYNALHQFTQAGLLRQVIVDGAKTYFDTNISGHHHFYNEQTGALSDIAGDSVSVSGLPPAPHGSEIESIDVTVRLKLKNKN